MYLIFLGLVPPPPRSGQPLPQFFSIFSFFSLIPHKLEMEGAMNSSHSSFTGSQLLFSCKFCKKNLWVSDYLLDFF